jgi:hypothetical protein
MQHQHCCEDDWLAASPVVALRAPTSVFAMATAAVSGEPEWWANATVRSSGSRSVLDVLRGWLGIPRRNVHEGSDSVEVTCHLRSSIPSLPYKFTYGVLVIAPTAVTWRAWLHASDVRVVPAMTAIDEVRKPGGHGEWNIKRGVFRVIKASGPLGIAEFAVPTADVRRVRDALTSDLAG